MSPKARKRSRARRYIRYHSSDDMEGLGEFRDVAEPVAVVLRPDGSVDAYGCIAVVDQRPGFTSGDDPHDLLEATDNERDRVGPAVSRRPPRPARATGKATSRVATGER